MKQSIRTFYKIFLILLLSVYGISNIHAKTESKKFTVVIDAGHGGKDIGATDNGVMEKNINLKVAKQLESLIKKKMKNAEVVMTRDGDTYLTLQQRADKANKAHGDIYISIHTNSVDKKNKNRKNIAGSSVYTLGLHKDENNLDVAMRENSVIELEKDYQQKYSGFDPQKDESYIIFEMAQKKNLSQSISFAENVEKELVKSGRQDRGVHQAGFWVLWATSMPSVLIELDFICNPESARYISSDKGAKELAEAIFRALERYQTSWNKNQNGAIAETGEVYVSGSPSELEESITISSATPVATAKTRIHKSSPAVKGTKVAQSGERRRRSSKSRQLSLNQSFENDALSISQSKNYAVATMDVNDELAGVSDAKTSNKPASNKKSRAEKKKEAKEKKEARKLAQKAAKEEKKRKKDAHNAQVNKHITVYKIQVLASTDLLNPNSSRFCGLSPITTYKENNLYKYYYGETTDKSELEAVLADVRKKIPDAFIVASQKSR